MSLCLTIAISILDKLLPDGTAIHKDYPYYSPGMWNFFVVASFVMIYVRYHWKL
ncbi:unnamed protein product, partial [Larinioides sclopetarius]